ncbi:MAG: S-layer homology domain-containing protein [Lachnospiraceae bacterium]|nr:S-layer homology domain-containing protein [Lachnospiraceae bacterium]
MRKRIITVIVALALILGTFYTGNPASVYAANEETQDNMTDVILKIKTKLELPDEYTEFNYNYNNYGTRGTWYFYWSTEDGTKSISLTCDDAAHIINMNSYDNKNVRNMPDKTSDELLGTANELLERVFPEAVGHVTLKTAYCAYYRGAYTFRFVRYENEIEMPDNYVVLSVGYENGDLIGLESNWNYTAKVPAAKGLISKDEAKAKIAKKLDMNLYYYVTRDDEGKDKVFLAYVPSMSYISVNAKNGKIYTKKSYWGDDPEMNDEDVTAESADAKEVNGRGYEATLSEAEIKKIADLENLISSDDAVNIIRNNDHLLIDENTNSVTASLRESDGKYYWNISLRDNRPEDYENGDYYRGYASATIDAADGRIMSYYSSVKSLYYYSDQDIDSIKFNYSKKDCKNVFEKFVKELENDKFSQVKLESSSSAMSEKSENTGKIIDMAYSYNYKRYNDGVPFISNGISGSVDRVTGKVYSYRVNWTDAEIPSAKDVIGAEKAYDAYMGYEGFDLVYELVNKYTNTGSIYGDGNEQSIRLVYRTAISPAYVDAFTGKQLTYNGQEYEDVRTDYKYNDIAGTKYEKAIKILAELGIGLPGESFEPDKKITGEELISMITKMPYIGYRDLTEEYKESKQLSHQEAAKVMLSVLGLDVIAELDIYKLNYKDASDVAKGYEGYVALAGAMGLFGDKNAKKFSPKAALTRGEAAQLLLNTAAFVMTNSY